MKGAISMSEQLAKRIYDESNGLWYELHGDYYLPCLTIDDGPTGLWGEQHRAFLRECRKNMYDAMVLNGRLHDYLLTINDQAEQRMELLVQQMQDAQGVTEQLKAEQPMEWVGRMNNIRACAREIVEREIICA